MNTRACYIHGDVSKYDAAAVRTIAARLEQAAIAIGISTDEYNLRYEQNSDLFILSYPSVYGRELNDQLSHILLSTSLEDADLDDTASSTVSEAETFYTAMPDPSSEEDNYGSRPLNIASLLSRAPSALPFLSYNDDDDDNNEGDGPARSPLNIASLLRKAPSALQSQNDDDSEGDDAALQPLNIADLLSKAPSALQTRNNNNDDDDGPAPTPLNIAGLLSKAPSTLQTQNDDDDNGDNGPARPRLNIAALISKATLRHATPKVMEHNPFIQAPAATRGLQSLEQHDSTNYNRFDKFGLKGHAERVAKWQMQTPGMRFDDDIATSASYLTLNADDDMSVEPQPWSNTIIPSTAATATGDLINIDPEDNKQWPSLSRPVQSKSKAQDDATTRGSSTQAVPSISTNVNRSLTINAQWPLPSQSAQPKSKAQDHAAAVPSSTETDSDDLIDLKLQPGIWDQYTLSRRTKSPHPRHHSAV